MKKLSLKIQKFEFEGRIFISFGIVALMCVLSFVPFDEVPSSILIIGEWVDLAPNQAYQFGYLIVAAIMVGASLLRMWAGSILTSQRMMAFKVQKDKLEIAGPYLLVRNPIYLADLFAFFGFALCLKPIAILLPILLYLHYTQLVKYEEYSLVEKFGQEFQSYMEKVPRFLPNVHSFKQFPSVAKDFYINLDGFRHNALYLLFIPGFLVAAFIGSLSMAILIGLPAVFDWAIVHTRKGLAPEFSASEKIVSDLAKSDIKQKKVFQDILYAQCWEDPQIDRAAFNINSDDVVFSITSGGCNVLTFLIDNPQKIVALDLNPYQNYLLDLKMAGFKSLHYDELLEFIGVKPSLHRYEHYEKVRHNLSPESHDYWDHQPEKIKAGIIHCGRYENYMRLLRKWLYRLMGRSLVEEFFAAESRSERAELYNKKWDNLRWKFLTGILLSRNVMTLLFDKAFFEQLEDAFSFGEHFRQIVKRALIELPLKENYFLSYILLGRYDDERFLPVYLRHENFKKIQSRLDRIQLINGSCEDYFAKMPDHSISKFNFTNIFEWISPDAFEQLLQETVRVAKDGAVITYRNLLVPRSSPESLSNCIKPQKQLSNLLHNRDLSFIYKAYVVERIIKEQENVVPSRNNFEFSWDERLPAIAV
jgi:S-adenosylmethionine-diacylglycerol 3-amino-3-carboxypropyl transferase